MLKGFIFNWQTSLFGATAILTAVSGAVDKGALTPTDIAAILGGLGLIFGKDGNKTGLPKVG